MSAALRLHRPTIAGRIRADARMLMLIGVVIALTAALTAAVSPLTERTADRSIAGTVRDAGPRGAVVATFPRADDEDPRGQTRDPQAAVKLRQDSEYAQFTMPERLAGVLRPGVASLTSPELHLLDAGAGRYLQLAYLDPPDGAPAVTYTAGGPPQASVGADQAEIKVPSGGEPWPVQVAVSEATAAALDLEPGDQLPAEDVQYRRVDVRISGVFTAADTDDDAWQPIPELLNPVQGTTEGVERTSAAALVSAESLPDLRLAVADDALTQRVVFSPVPAKVTWGRSVELAQDVVSLKASPGLARAKISWDSQLDLVLDDGRTQIAAARGQADVLLVGLLVCSLLLMIQAAQLLVRRRAGSVASARERGASLTAIGAELFVESLAVGVVGTAVGLLVTRLVVGEVGWEWVVPVLVVASLAAPVLGVLLAARSVDVRRVPANRSARRTALRAREQQRLLVELLVVAAAVLAYVALRQRGVTGGDDGSGDLTAASAATWWAVAGALLVLRALPALAGLLLRRSRRARGGSLLFAAARTAQSGARALPLLVVTVAVAQLTLGLALAATEHEGQAAGALLAVGGDVRLTTAPDRAVLETAAAVDAAPGVRAAVAGRVEDGVRASAKGNAATVRLVVVEAAAYERLLAESALPDAPQLDRLSDPAGDVVPALLLGGDPGLKNGLVVRWDDVTVPLDVVGVAPRVDASADPVVVVDAQAFTDAGAGAQPDTVWAVGPGAAEAVRAAAGDTGTVDLYDDVLADRRAAPLASALVRLSVLASGCLLLLAVLGVALGAAAESQPRGESLGRLRSLGLRSTELWRVLVGELMTPVVVAVVAGLALGAGAALAMFGSLSLELVTGQGATPGLVVPWWPLLAGLAVVSAVLVIARVESGRLRRTSLALLLRAGDRR